ncbi:putative regulatory protein [Chytridium lagenaria]|nr:putative regulatory protein [Chytridium lagenaria]
MLLGPDGKPCRVCDSFKNFTKENSSKFQEKSSDQQQKSTQGTEATSKVPKFPCPPDSQELGAATWTFLHTMAAYYPDQPSEVEQKTMRNFFRAFSKVYPCSYCATHLRQELKTNPPKLQSNKDLNYWLCGVHNEVNERLGKPIFDCSKVWERWRDARRGLRLLIH